MFSFYNSVNVTEPLWSPAEIAESPDHREYSEVVSKPYIRFKSKAQTDEKAQHTRWYVSILKRFATQLLGLRWGFETTSS
jgi:hypothetical protein